MFSERDCSCNVNYIHIGLAMLLLGLQRGDCGCIYDIASIENGITFTSNVDNTESVFKFTIVNQTGQIMTNKHIKMITEYSHYYYVSNDYLKLKMCPYPGLVEDLEFGIEDEIYCNVTVKVTVKAAISELPIPGEVFVRVDSQTKEYEILIYLLQLNISKECAVYYCYIECENDKKQHFIAATAGSREEFKSLFYVYTAPYSIKYSPFRYKLLFACYDMNFHVSTLVTVKTYFTFIDTSATISKASSHLSLAHTAGTNLSPELTSKSLRRTETEVLLRSENMSPSLPTFITETIVPSQPVAFNAKQNVSSLISTHRQTAIFTSRRISNSWKASAIYLTKVSSAVNASMFNISSESPRSKRTVTSNSGSGKTQTSTQFGKFHTFEFETSHIFTASPTSSANTFKPRTPNDLYFLTPKNTHFIPTQTPVEYSLKTVSEDTKMGSLTNTFNAWVARKSTLMISDKTHSTRVSLTEKSAVNHESSLDVSALVIVISSVAGVVAAVTVGAGTFLLVYKRFETHREKNESSDETENIASSTDDGKISRHEASSTNRRTGQLLR